MTQPTSDPDLRGLNFPMSLQPAARKLMEGAVGIVARRVIREVIAARKDGLPVALLEVRAGTEPVLEDWQEVVIRVTVLLAPEQAVAAWDSLERRLELLRDSLDMLQREILDEAVALQLVWREDGDNDAGFP